MSDAIAGAGLGGGDTVAAALPVCGCGTIEGDSKTDSRIGAVATSARIVTGVASVSRAEGTAGAAEAVACDVAVVDAAMEIGPVAVGSDGVISGSVMPACTSAGAVPCEGGADITLGCAGDADVAAGVSAALAPASEAVNA